jgi:hypothetical protein
MANDLGDSNEHLKFTRKRILILKLIFRNWRPSKMGDFATLLFVHFNFIVTLSQQAGPYDVLA